MKKIETSIKTNPVVMYSNADVKRFAEEIYECMTTFSNERF
jgi:hypothetical protein